MLMVFRVGSHHFVFNVFFFKGFLLLIIRGHEVPSILGENQSYFKSTIYVCEYAKCLHGSYGMGISGDFFSGIIKCCPPFFQGGGGFVKLDTKCWWFFWGGFPVNETVLFWVGFISWLVSEVGKCINRNMRKGGFLNLLTENTFNVEITKLCPLWNLEEERIGTSSFKNAGREGIC